MTRRHRLQRALFWLADRFLLRPFGQGTARVRLADGRELYRVDGWTGRTELNASTLLSLPSVRRDLALVREIPVSK